MTNQTPTAAVEDAIDALNSIENAITTFVDKDWKHYCDIVRKNLTHSQPQSAGCEGLVETVRDFIDLVWHNEFFDLEAVPIENYKAFIDMKAALEAFKSPPVADKWQDISTYKNEGVVLVTRERAPYLCPVVTAFRDVTDQWLEFRRHGKHIKLQFEPTYWKPLELPEPPVAGGEK